MEKTDSNIHTTVMRRVHRIHTLRAVLGSAGASFFLLAASLYFIGREVWVARVFENMPHSSDALAIVRFFVEAFVTTDVAVQAFTLLSALAFAWMLREAGKLVVQPMKFA
jgi:hypothetical protein